jgi:sec-independent protein translocase protein TatA
MAGLTGWHFLIIALVILLLFGATRLPALAKGLGQSMKIFKNELKKDDDETKTSDGVRLNETSPEVQKQQQQDSTESNPKP